MKTNSLKFLVLITLFFVFSCQKEELFVEEDVFVEEIVEPLSIEGGEYLEVPEYLSTPINGSELIVPVVIINWVPSPDGIVVNDSITLVGGNMDWGNEVKTGMKVSTVDQWNLSNNMKLKYSIEEGSKFRGYDNPNELPYVGIQVVKYINIYNMPLVNPNDGIQSSDTEIPDYDTLFENIGMEELVNVYGVKEVWMNWTNYKGNLWIPESNMSSPVSGDISNSYKRQDDLPIYNNTYVVYATSFDRWFAEAIHCRGHQIEAQLSHLNNTFFWQDFVGYPHGEPQPYYQGGRVGSTHYTPNSVSDYDYDNTDLIMSDIGDWNPDHEGHKEHVNNSTWKYSRQVPFTYPTVIDHDRWDVHSKSPVGSDPQSGWLIYWFQSIPSKDNGIKYQGEDGSEISITNWWDLYYNWDDTISNEKKLYN
jgi:hypothetical protein